MACGAGEQRTARIFQLTGFTNRSFDAKGEAIGMRDFQLRSRTSWAEHANAGQGAFGTDHCDTLLGSKLTRLA
ncbi:hypothetical protein D3C79_1097870 [compost metagenome]